jgi:hypothetical protein
VLVVPDKKYFSSALVGSLGLLCRYKRFFFSLGCSNWPSANIFFLTVHFFNSFEPIAQKAGQAAVLGRLSLSICHWFIPKPMPEFFSSAKNSINSTSALIVLPLVDYSLPGKYSSTVCQI